MFVTNTSVLCRLSISTLAGCLLALLPDAASINAAERSVEKPPASVSTEKPKYLRVVHDAKDRVVGLETAITSFRPAAGPGGVQVDLVAAVHVADKRYYQELNKRFADYDVVLYELVAPEGTRIPKGGRKEGGSMLSSVQIGMKNALDLDYQLDEIDYTAKNFVHADLSPDEFVKSMQNNNEGFVEIIARLIALGLAKESSGKGDSDSVQLLLALFDSNRALALKRAVAEQFEDSEDAMAILEGPTGSTLIGERNKRALEVLKKQLAAGKKKIAIFYGGGHMPDMEKHLRADFGMKADKTEWLRAWDMK